MLETEDIPALPKESCSFSQLLNPEGLEVDYFVSLFWGHIFQQTISVLPKFTEGLYEGIGKSHPDEVTFWVRLCTGWRALNSALAHKKHGSLIAMDGDAKPMSRI